MNKVKTFLFLDDDAFHPDKIRNPEIYYPLIGAIEILELMKNFEVKKFINVEQCQAYMVQFGCPNFISFDNDLKEELEGHHLAKWMVERDMDYPGFIPDDFQFFVHSQNIKAKENIYGYLGQYLELRNKANKFGLK